MIIVAFFLVAIVVGIIISVGGQPKCKEKYKIDDPTTNLTYRLSYCGREGRYCEQIMRFRRLNVIQEKCSHDPEYSSINYVGVYTYYENYLTEEGIVVVEDKNETEPIHIPIQEVIEEV